MDTVRYIGCDKKSIIFLDFYFFHFFIDLFIYLFIYLLIYLFIYLFIYFRGRQGCSLSFFILYSLSLPVCKTHVNIDRLHIKLKTCTFKKSNLMSFQRKKKEKLENRKNQYLNESGI